MRWYARPEGVSQQLRVAPRLASWEKADHLDQVRLRAYLEDTEALLAASRGRRPWALRRARALVAGCPQQHTSPPLKAKGDDNGNCCMHTAPRGAGTG
jgi:hypothetical protein